MFLYQTFNLAWGQQTILVEHPPCNDKCDKIADCKRTPSETDIFSLEKRRQNCRRTVLNHVPNPLSTRDRGTFESNAVRLRARAASLIAQFVGARASSLIAQFLADQAGFDRVEARAASIYSESRIALSLIKTNSTRRCKTCEGWDPVVRASPLISDRHKNKI